MEWIRKLLLSSFVLVMFVLSPSALAESAIHPQVVLKSIKQITAQESHDEIYLLVSDLHAKDNNFYTIPGKQDYFKTEKMPQPLVSYTAPHAYWNDTLLSRLQNVSVWHRTLAKDESTQLIISLVEADFPPWDLDDMVGSVKINLANIDNQLKVVFVPFSYTKLLQQKIVTNGSEYTVNIKNGHSEYEVVYSVLTHAANASGDAAAAVDKTSAKPSDKAAAKTAN